MKKHLTLKQFYIVFYYKMILVLKYLVALLLIFLLIVGVIVAYTNNKTFAKYHIAVVTSNSMMPILNKNDVIISQKETSYKEGDIITFFKDAAKPDKTTTHRIVSSENGTFITKGDANNSNDPLKVHESEILGKMLFNLPKMGSIILFVRTVPGVILTVIIPATMLLTLFLVDFSNSLKSAYHKAKCETNISKD